MPDQLQASSSSYDDSFALPSSSGLAGLDGVNDESDDETEIYDDMRGSTSGKGGGGCDHVCDLAEISTRSVLCSDSGLAVTRESRSPSSFASGSPRAT